MGKTEAGSNLRDEFIELLNSVRDHRLEIVVDQLFSEVLVIEQRQRLADPQVERQKDQSPAA